MERARALLALPLCVAGCGCDHALGRPGLYEGDGAAADATVDAARVPPDASADAALDAPIDAARVPPDAGADAAPDAGPDAAIVPPPRGGWTPLGGAPSAGVQAAVWTGSEMITWGLDAGRYDPVANAWRPTSPDGVPDRTAAQVVWTGSEMIAWNGTSGGRYDPVADTWRPMSAVGGAGTYAPVFVWTGSEVLSWGGRSPEPAAAGARYDPVADAWSPMAAGGPLAPGGVWTGSELLVWGAGAARYDPASDAWRPMSGTGATEGLLYVWTGSEVLSWGRSDPLSPGAARYDPTTDRWSPMSGLPTSSIIGTAPAVWTGSEAILSTAGYRYDPVTDTYSAMSSLAEPEPRFYFAEVWTGSALLIWGGGLDDGASSAPLEDGARYDPVADAWTPIDLGGRPQSRMRAMSAWTGSELIVWGGDGGENGYAGDGDSEESYLDTGGVWIPGSDTWRRMSHAGAPPSRINAATVWTGSEFVVWGGEQSSSHDCSFIALDSGGRYDPFADTWRGVARTDEPMARTRAGAVWTGSEMLVWGGAYDPCGYGSSDGLLGDGARYDPSFDTWSPISSLAAPAARHSPVVAWTGSEMIVWGGSAPGYAFPTMADGARYDPIADAWRTLTAAGSPPPRVGAAVAWTGSEIIVWGGRNWSSMFGDGAGYDPAVDEWRAVAMRGAPSPRFDHSAVWTGSQMLVWDGADIGEPVPGLRTGAAYDPVADAWSPLPTLGAPSARSDAVAAWTGSEMVVWGGFGGGPLATGARYRP